MVKVDIWLIYGFYWGLYIVYIWVIYGYISKGYNASRSHNNPIIMVYHTAMLDVFGVLKPT